MNDARSARDAGRSAGAASSGAASPAGALGTPPPAHILNGFHAHVDNPVQLDQPWSYGWRCDRAVISLAEEPMRASWIAKTTAKMRPAGVGVSRPMLSTDGRYTVSGWRARTFLSGHRAPRFDEMAAAALRINESLRGLPRPEFLAPPELTGTWGQTEIFAAADAAAFAEQPQEWIAPAMDATAVPRKDIAEALAKAVEVTALRTEITAEDQLVHGDVIGCMIFDGAADPAITDLVPAWHPTGWSVALLVVDAMAWGNGDDALLDRWSHIPDFMQLALRAVLYRLALHAMLPNSRPEAWPGLSRTADVIAAREQQNEARQEWEDEGEPAEEGGDDAGEDAEESVSEPAGKQGSDEDVEDADEGGAEDVDKYPDQGRE
ncbi:TIGR02569 family protein [Corynebacterium sp. HMSC22B11]|uniref:TIGR02569 family protein n=1 Tax=Corynebacterium sp. HMSC22B11 TaxID=1581056 RepID=UPI000B2BE6A8|nr:TIGR02569 family protein [Corynebacterium sp. HMSC22B11]